MLRLEMLAADYGDALWLEYGEPGQTHAVLIDAGPGDTYRTAVRPRLEAFARGRTKPQLDLLVVTHIDNDHIVGALKFVQDTDIGVKINEVWFNGWDQIAPDMLGVKEGVELAAAIKKRRLKHNAKFQGRAVMTHPAAEPPTIALPGGLSLTVLSPGPAQIARLRAKWEKVVADLDAKAKAKPPADLLGGEEPDIEELAAAKFKPDAAVANGSSIALLAEYRGHRVLLAADSFPAVVEASLRRLEYCEEKPVPLAAYKLSHHGSRGNNSPSLLSVVRCDKYLFSTSGARFGHPHDECVARVLVGGGKAVRLYTNYRRDGETLLWDHPTVRTDYKATVVRPKKGTAGLVVPLA